MLINGWATGYSKSCNLGGFYKTNREWWIRSLKPMSGLSGWKNSQRLWILLLFLSDGISIKPLKRRLHIITIPKATEKCHCSITYCQTVCHMTVGECFIMILQEWCFLSLEQNPAVPAKCCWHNLFTWLYGELTLKAILKTACINCFLTMHNCIFATLQCLKNLMFNFSLNLYRCKDTYIKDTTLQFMRDFTL